MYEIWRNGLLFGLATVSLVFGGQARASGGVVGLSLKQAVQDASFVLEVRPAKPPTVKLTVQVPYRKEGKQQLARLPTVFSRYTVVKVLYRSPSLPDSSSGNSRLRPGQKHRFVPAMLKAGSTSERVAEVSPSRRPAATGNRARSKSARYRFVCMSQSFQLSDSTSSWGRPPLS